MAENVALFRTERAGLVELLEQLGPAAPTLCEGWSTGDLAAHIVARERRPDSAPGFVVGAFSRHSEKVRASYLSRPYAELLELIRSGPLRWTPFGLPPFEAAANTTEFFVHHEDVRRAQAGWQPRVLTAAQQNELWRLLIPRAKIAFRRAGCGVVLQRSDVSAADAVANTAFTAKSGSPAGVVTGEPQELLLFAYGRRAHARVAVSGPRAAQAVLAHLPLGA